MRDREKKGGHSVPEDEILRRYERSLELLIQAVQYSNHSYILDNSTQKLLLIAEVIEGRILEMKTNQMPVWFKKALWDKFNAITKIRQTLSAMTQFLCEFQKLHVDLAEERLLPHKV